MERLVINGLNEACNNISAIYLKVGNESMSDIRFGLQRRGTYLNCTIFSQYVTTGEIVQECGIFCY